MNTFKILFIVSFFFSSILFAQEERKVLVEVFTNSHCPLCPPAHNTIENYINGPNGDQISFIFYHMVYPYSDDQLNHQSMSDSQARDDYYNPVPATPRGFFDGIIQGSWSGWTAVLDNLTSTESPMRLALSGSANGNQITINSTVTRTGDVSDTDLVMHFVVIEDVFYAGRNGITNHIHVMRKMLPSPSGMPFSINQNESIDIDQVIDIDTLWDVNDLNIVVFVQSTGSKTVYQSETIGYNDLKITGVEDDISVPNEFSLQQNYPNPFNPTTIILYAVSNRQFVSIKVYNMLGNEVATIVNEELPAGNYKVEYDASNLPSGIYFYTLTASGFAETKKMILLK